MQQITAGLFFVVAATALATTQSALRPVVISAQASVTGTWRSDSVAPVTLVLRTEGAIVTGVVDRCSSTSIVPTEISDGRIDGDTVNFTCISPDGDRTVSFTGTIAGDEIRFTWQLQVREGGRPPALYEPFGPFPGLRVQPPPRFTARRVSESVGTAVLNRLAERWRDVPGATSVTFERILRADQEPHNWLTYSGNLLGHRHSPLTEITRDNVKDLHLAWTWPQSRSAGRFHATPLVVDGVLYTVEAPNTVVALDAATGQFLWDYRYTPPVSAGASGGGGRVNRGLAVVGDTLFMGTLDAHLLAIDARRGTLRWNRTVADYQDATCQEPTTGTWCYNITLAPLVVKNMVLVGVGGGDGGTPGFGIRGFIAAFDARTGTEVWRFYTVPAPGEPGNDTWSGDSWKAGGAGVWVTGAYDPQLNLTYWGVGNPSPPDGRTRLGDNLYSDSVVALDADSGKLRWHYQFMPHDEVDWDAGQIPVLTDLVWQGSVDR
jgi:outer membrane protein assembly factor BamB